MRRGPAQIGTCDGSRTDTLNRLHASRPDPLYGYVWRLEIMKVNFSAEITDLRGNPVKDGDENLTLGAVACSAMLAVMSTDQNLPSAEKVRMFRLAQKAADGGEVEVTAEDVVLLKDRIGTLYGALIVGRVYDLVN